MSSSVIWPKPGSIRVVGIIDELPPDATPEQVDAFNLVKGVRIHVRLLPASKRDLNRLKIASAIARERARLNVMRKSGDYDMDYVAQTEQGMVEFNTLARDFICLCVERVENLGECAGLSGEALCDFLDNVDMLEAVSLAARKAQDLKPHQSDS
jgi:hypothetical protein